MDCLSRGMSDSTEKESKDRARRLEYLRSQETGTRHLKFSILGDRAVGKTAMLVALVNRQFASDYLPDEFEEMYSVNLLSDGIPVNIQLCDTPGDHLYFKHGRRPCLAGVDAFVICVNLESHNSLVSAVNFWHPLVRKMSGDAPIILIGTKDDLNGIDNNDDVVTDPELNEVGVTIGAYMVSTISAEEDQEEVYELFQQITKKIFGTKVINPNKKDCIVQQ